jgi:hypothetical protein
MCAHPKTDEAVAQFMRDFAEWSRPTLTEAEAILAGGVRT